jgi:uncharacterized membrane protein
MPRPDLTPLPDPVSLPPPAKAKPAKAQESKRTRSKPVQAPQPAAKPLPPYLWHWLLLSVVALGYILALLIFPPLFTAPDHPGSDAVLFVGRFHPILLHLPVGALIILLILEIASLRECIEEQWSGATLFISLINAASSVVAVVAGLMLSREGFEGGDYKLHTFFGVIIGFGAIIAAFCRLSAMTIGEGKGLLETNRFVLLVTFVAMSVGAHFGANMVHTDKYLTQHAPKPIADAMKSFEAFMRGFVNEKKKPIAAPAIVKTQAPKQVPTPPVPATVPTVTPPVPQPPTPAPANVAMVPPATTPPIAVPAPPTPATGTGDDVVVYSKLIQPILDAKCNGCHDEAKTKGKLRTDTYELLMQGGQDTVKTIIPGNVEGSLAIIRIELPKEEDEHMPPENKDQMTPEELALIKAWIAAGASNTQTLKDAKLPPALQPTIDALLKK